MREKWIGLKWYNIHLDRASAIVQDVARYHAKMQKWGGIVVFAERKIEDSRTKGEKRNKSIARVI